MVYPSSLGQFRSEISNMTSYMEQTVTNMTMHNIILMMKKMTRLIGKENSVAALSVIEIRKLPVTNMVRLIVPTIMSYFVKAMRNSRKTCLKC